MSMREDVAAVIEEMRPYINLDGGEIELINVDETTGVVTVQLLGACESCSLTSITLKAGVETRLKAQIQGVTEVVAV